MLEYVLKADFQLLHAYNGREAITLFKLYNPVILLMDIRMPHMTGYEATQAIRRSSHPDASSVPIIAMSADAFSDDIQRCLDCGMNAHAAKPIDIMEIAKLFEKYLK